MKNLKKVLALVLACATLFTMSSFAFSDVAEDASYLEAVTMLSKLGIINGYEDGTFLPDNTITRAEAAKVLVCALNAEDSAKGMADQELFTDVPKTHWAAGYVNYAANFGIIAGRGNGIFDPESPVSYEEIVKMVVAMLGYTPVANIKGGYPTGYLYVANSVAKITKGATGTTGDAAKRWVVARLVFNSLETKIMEPEKWSASDPEYIKGEDTLLKDYLEVTKVEGVITDTFLAKADFQDKEDQDVDLLISTIDGKTKRALENDNISYNSMPGDTYTVDANGTYAEDYLGYTVVAYVKDFDEGSDVLVAVAPKANKNTTLDVAFDDFEKDTVDNSNSKYIEFEYYANVDDEDTTKGKISKKNDDFYVYQNGRLDSSLNSDTAIVNFIKQFSTDYDAEEGYIRFVDNDGDNYADYLFVETINDEYVVDSITAKSYKIEDKINSKTITLDPTDDEKYVNFYRDGVQVEFSSIKEGDTLSVAYNKSTLKNSNVVSVYISSEKAEGYVSTASATKNEYKIDGTVYAKSSKYTETIKRGDEGTFYLNYKGRVAYKEAQTSKEGNYAFLLSVNTDDDFADGKSFTLRFMNEKGEWVDAKLYEKLAIYDEDGQQVAKYKDMDALEAGIEANTNNWLAVNAGELELDGAKAQRIFKYTLNSNGDITKITLPKNGLNEDKFTYEVFTDETYKESSNRFAGIKYKGGVDKKTVVFNIDVDTDNVVDVTKKKEVSLATSTLFKDESKYTGIAYDYADDAYKCMVITNAGNKIDEESSLLVIQSAELTSNDDDDYFVITGYKDGKEVTLESVAIEDLGYEGTKVTTDSELENLDGGAIAEISVDGAGKIDNIKVLFKFDDAQYGVTVSDGNLDEDAAYVYGAISSKKVSGTGKVVDLAKDYSTASFASIATAGAGMKGNIYLVESGARKNTISVDTSIADYVDSLNDDLGTGDEVYCAFAKLYDGDTVDVVVYKIKL